jgi:Fic-DOC domain mobile mystery protein B
MGLTLFYEDGQTPLNDEEKDGLLIPAITTKGELDELEQFNIQKAIQWTLKRRWKPATIFTERFVKQLHYQMYGEVWGWAGEFRKTNKNIGVDRYRVGSELKMLLDDCLYWVDNNTYPANEIAIRFKHRLVAIHCFANGNGRHSRLIADVIISNVFGEDVYTWVNSGLIKADELRKQYITSLKKADNGEIEPLIVFVLS